MDSMGMIVVLLVDKSSSALLGCEDDSQITNYCFS